MHTTLVMCTRVCAHAGVKWMLQQRHITCLNSCYLAAYNLHHVYTHARMQACSGCCSRGISHVSTRATLLHITCIMCTRACRRGVQWMLQQENASILAISNTCAYCVPY